MGKNTSEQETTSNVTTTTTTTIGDIGLTGQNAVDMTAILQAGALQSEKLRAKQATKLYQNVGKAYNQLIGGAGNFLIEQSKTNRDTLNRSLDFASATLNSQLQSNRDTLSAAASLTGSAAPKFSTVPDFGFSNSTPQEKTMMLLAVAGVAVTLVAVMRK